MRIPSAERPNFAPDYGISNAPPTAEHTNWSVVVEKLTVARNYWISSSSPEGRPHAAPVWGLWIDGALYFGTDPRSKKARNFAANPRVVVHLESGDDVIILEGSMEALQGSETPSGFLDAYEAKYSFRPPFEPDGPGPLRLRPTSALTWLETDFVNSAIRWRF